MNPIYERGYAQYRNTLDQVTEMILADYKEKHFLNRGTAVGNA